MFLRKFNILKYHEIESVFLFIQLLVRKRKMIVKNRSTNVIAQTFHVAKKIINSANCVAHFFSDFSGFKPVIAIFRDQHAGFCNS